MEKCPINVAHKWYISLPLIPNPNESYFLNAPLCKISSTTDEKNGHLHIYLKWLLSIKVIYNHKETLKSKALLALLYPCLQFSYTSCLSIPCTLQPQYLCISYFPCKECSSPHFIWHLLAHQISAQISLPQESLHCLPCPHTDTLFSTMFLLYDMYMINSSRFVWLSDSQPSLPSPTHKLH